MKRLICLALVLFCTAGAFAQKSKIPTIIDIAEVEVDNQEAISVFNMPKDGENHYYLCVGTLGFGDHVIQLLFDPVFRLFLPLGDTLEESTASLQELKDLFRQPKGTCLEKQASFAFGFPNDKLETVKITHYKGPLGAHLEFSLEREGYIRATHLTKGQISSLLSSIKIYRKLHKKEK